MTILERPVLFLDDEMIGAYQRVARRWLSADVAGVPVLLPDEPWEDRTLEFPSIVRIGQVYRCYYTAVERPSGRRRLLVAESSDGFRWTKPGVGEAHADGPGRTNIVGSWDGIFNSPNVIHDARWASPYRMVAFLAPDPTLSWAPDWGLYTWESADGLQWNGPRHAVRTGDRNTLCRDDASGAIWSYNRAPDATMMAQTGGRAIYRSVSEDFEHWTDPELVLRPDLEDGPHVEFYGMVVFRRHDWFLGLLEVWQRDIDVLEIQLAFSRDGVNWRRPVGRQPFIGAGDAWNSHWSTSAGNGPVQMGDCEVFYVNGRRSGHSYDSARQDGTIGVASLGVDRYCAIESDVGGFVETPPLDWPQRDLVVNADTRRSFSSHPASLDGVMRIEALGADREPLAGWSGSDAARFVGNTYRNGRVYERLVRWPGDVGLGRLAGQRIWPRFTLDHARLFSFSADGRPYASPGDS